MGERRNRRGIHYGLTVFTPIAEGKEAEVRARIESLQPDEDSPLAGLDSLHFARLVIMDRINAFGPKQKKPDTLKYPYLVFTAVFDGDLDRFLDAICDRIPDAADDWWGACVGYPGTSDRRAFADYIRAHQIDAAVFEGAEQKSTVAERLASLDLRDRVIRFAGEGQSLDPAALKERFLASFAGDA